MSGAHLRFINVLILILFCTLGFTGLYSLVSPFPSSLFQVHRIAGWALIVLVPWKTAISLRSLSRGINHLFDRNVMIIVSLLLTVATFTVLVLVILWKWQIGSYYVWIGPFAYSAIGWHWGIALGLTPLFILHVWRRWPRPRQTDFTGRRQALKLLGLGAAAMATWGISEVITKSAEQAGAARRFTGSREQGSFRGLDYPITSAADQGKIKLDPSTWKLTIEGQIKNPLTLSYDKILTLSNRKVTATIDCTGGWFSTQIWRGVPLAELLAQVNVLPAKHRVLLKDVSGYTSLITPDEVSEILLATYVGDQVLNHWHGFPVRVVVPSRRGGYWVKWLTEIEVTAA
jgi:hypothetical protein